MPDPSLDWLDTLPDLRVPGVLGVPSRKTALSFGTPAETARVPGVLIEFRNTLEHSAYGEGVPPKCMKNHKEHPEHTGTRDGGNVAERACVPSAIMSGLRRLKAQPAPRITRPEIWPSIVADALRLSHQGWAAKALALGWHPLQLFGCSPAIGGGPDLDGLAVWLTDRRLVLLDASTAIVTDGGKRSIFYPRPTSGAVMLWELGHSK